ncbi:MAG: hypothetical protein LAQ69_15860 [Acidobacteriia bacterium]|nr:hypothetical protein [Terriglobia bacterium]
MRMLLCLPLLLVSGPANAWDTTPHQRITKAAIDTLPKRFLTQFGAEIAPLIEIYCLLPDRYVEMQRFGFVRRSPGPRSASEIEVYCIRPDGQAMHGATGVRDTDIGSLVYLFERMVSTFSQNRPGEAARYAGVLSHFIADSLSPPHAVSPEHLLGMAPPSAETGDINIHSAIERSIPEFTLGGREPRRAGAHIVTAAQAILERCYSGAARNRRDLPSMVKAACARDEQTLDVYRLRAGMEAAEIFADALYTVLRIEEGVRQAGPGRPARTRRSAPQNAASQSRHWAVPPVELPIVLPDNIH